MLVQGVAATGAAHRGGLHPAGGLHMFPGSSEVLLSAYVLLPINCCCLSVALLSAEYVSESKECSRKTQRTGGPRPCSAAELQELTYLDQQEHIIAHTHKSSHTIYLYLLSEKEGR